MSMMMPPEITQPRTGAKGLALSKSRSSSMSPDAAAPLCAALAAAPRVAVEPSDAAP
jgi:hypothetical protein